MTEKTITLTIEAIVFITVIGILSTLFSSPGQTDAQRMQQEIKVLREEVRSLRQDKVETKERTKK